MRNKCCGVSEVSTQDMIWHLASPRHDRSLRRVTRDAGACRPKDAAEGRPDRPALHDAFSLGADLREGGPAEDALGLNSVPPCGELQGDG